MLKILVQYHRADDKPQETAPVLIGPADGVATVNGDEARLLRVFENLLNNSFSLALEKARIAIRVTVREELVEVSVEDIGSGMPVGSAEKIFERFYSERLGSESFGKHSGLGLRISRQIVASHGGDMRDQNRIGPKGEVLGAAFIVKLPNASIVPPGSERFAHVRIGPISNRSEKGGVSAKTSQRCVTN